MKKTYYCEKLEKTIHFLPDRISFCCSCAEGAHTKNINFENINLNEISKSRNKYIETLQGGIIPKECTGCNEYKEKKPENFISKFFKKEKNTNRIEQIFIDHFKQCECNCIYCSGKILYPNTTQNYNILPIIKELYKNKLIDLENLRIEFQGGNISMLEEFEDIIDEINSHHTPKYNFLSNNIKYIDTIEKKCNYEGNIYSVSLDCGSRETYKKIKMADEFDAVIENLKKIKNNTNLLIFLKYIIIEGINDNEKELTAFLNIAKEIEINGLIYLEIDYRKTFLNNPEEFKIPDKYYKLFELAEKYCKENNLPYLCNDYHKKLLEKGTNK